MQSLGIVGRAAPRAAGRYDESVVEPMRQELVRLGFIETRNADEVDVHVKAPGTALLVVNSVCGCAAGRTRPGVALARRRRRWDF